MPARGAAASKHGVALALAVSLGLSIAGTPARAGEQGLGAADDGFAARCATQKAADVRQKRDQVNAERRAAEALALSALGDSGLDDGDQRLVAQWWRTGAPGPGPAGVGDGALADLLWAARAAQARLDAEYARLDACLRGDPGPPRIAADAPATPYPVPSIDLAASDCGALYGDLSGQHRASRLVLVNACLTFAGGFGGDPAAAPAQRAATCEAVTRAEGAVALPSSPSVNRFTTARRAICASP